jgi:hypothetical protein
MTTLWENIESEFVALENDAINTVEAIAGLFEQDVWPYVKAGILTLLTVAGKAAMQAEVAAIPLEISGQVGAAASAVGAAIAGAVNATAEAVAITEGRLAVAAVNADANANDAEKAVANEVDKLLPTETPPTV